MERNIQNKSSSYKPKGPVTKQKGWKIKCSSSQKRDKRQPDKKPERKDEQWVFTAPQREVLC